MPHSKDWARKLLRELPDKSPEHMLRSRSYPDSTFLTLFFDWLDELIFHDPNEGLRWAMVAPDLALATPKGDGHRERVVKAFAIRGSAYRAIGDHAAADEAYREALQLTAETSSFSDLVRADTDRRLSYLRACQGRAVESLDLATGAVKILRRIADDGEAADADASYLLLGKALIARGYVLADELGRHNEAIDAFGEALNLAGDAKGQVARRIHASACHNLAVALSTSSSIGVQREAMLYVRQAHALVKGQKRSVARYRLCWVEGLIWCNLGSHAKAERLFRQALEGFRALKLPWEIALVSLDLGSLLHLCGEWAELEKIAGETFERFQLLAADTKALAALSLWNDAVKARRNEELVELCDKARQIIAAGVYSGRSSNRREP